MGELLIEVRAYVDLKKQKAEQSRNGSVGFVVRPDKRDNSKLSGWRTTPKQLSLIKFRLKRFVARPDKSLSTTTA